MTTVKYSSWNAVFAHIINFYLPPDEPNRYAKPGAKEAHESATDLYAQVVTVALTNTPDSAIVLEGYVREALSTFTILIFSPPEFLTMRI